MSKSFLLVSLEFAASTIFSGNGVLANVYAAQLARSGHRVDVLCARPVDDDEQQQEGTASVRREQSQHHEQLQEAAAASNLTILSVPVPKSKWRKLCHLGPWAEFAESVRKCLGNNNSDGDGDDAAATQSILKKLFEKHRGESSPSSSSPITDYDVAMIIDWHGFVVPLALTTGKINNNDEEETTAMPPPAQLRPRLASPDCRLVFLNFRVFCNRLLGDDDTSPEFAFYREHEVSAMECCDVTVVLSEMDRVLLKEMAGDKKIPPIEILPPPLQPAFLELCSKDNGGSNIEDNDSSYCFFLTSVVRLDASKGAHRFVDLVEVLSKRNNNSNDDSGKNFSLIRSAKHKNARCVPFVCGAAADAEYAADCKKRLRAACGDAVVIREDFVSPAELVNIWRSSAIFNFHCCTYDAYGMTLPEAAACGVLSTTHGTSDSAAAAASLCSLFAQNGEKWSSPVGACGLIRPESKEIVLLDWAQPPEKIADILEPILVQLLDDAVEKRRRCSAAAPSSDTVGKWVEGARARALSWDPAAAVELLLKYCA